MLVGPFFVTSDSHITLLHWKLDELLRLWGVLVCNMIFVQCYTQYITSEIVN